MSKQTVEEFSNEMKKKLDEFVIEWNKSKQINPEFFPTNLNPGEWDEQFIAFCSDCEII